MRLLKTTHLNLHLYIANSTSSEIRMPRCIYMHLCYLWLYIVKVHFSCLGSISVTPMHIPALVYVLYFGSQSKATINSVENSILRSEPKESTCMLLHN
jgi:hypothetical protein